MAQAGILEPRETVFAGIMLTGAAYALFSVQDAGIKLLVAAMSVWQVLLFRSLVVLAGCAAVGGTTVLRQAAVSPVLGAMILRSFAIVGAWLCYYTAARDLQLAELTTIYFAAPVIVMLLSIPILGERVPPVRWFAALLGFAGVFIACDPANLGIGLPVFLVLCAAVLWAFSIVLIRKLALQERTLVQLVLNNAFFLFIAGAPAVFLWHAPALPELALLLTVGGIGGIAQFMIFEGMKRAAASVVAPFEYTSLIWAFALGYLIWHDVPRIEVFIGAALIVGAGLVIIASERRRLRSV